MIQSSLIPRRVEIAEEAICVVNSTSSEKKGAFSGEFQKVDRYGTEKKESTPKRGR